MIVLDVQFFALLGIFAQLCRIINSVMFASSTFLESPLVKP